MEPSIRRDCIIIREIGLSLRHENDEISKLQIYRICQISDYGFSGVLDKFAGKVVNIDMKFPRKYTM